MELSPRKQAVLKAVINAYIAGGETVGSKNLIGFLENAPSSATLRNEMSELCELGLLKQPHTSAGRVPTSDGYKLYINTLMQNPTLSPTEKQQIDDAFENISLSPESIPSAAAQCLANLCELPAIACLITNTPSKIKKVEVLPISSFSVMLLLITDDGRTRNRIFRQKGLNADIKLRFLDLINKYIVGKNVNELTKAYMQSVIATAGIYSLDLMPLLTAVFETALEIEETDISLKGENALYNICSSEETAQRIMRLINRRDPIISILNSIDSDSGAVFGVDTKHTELAGDVILAAKFRATDKFGGYIGIIGPNRLSYEKIIPCIEYTAQKLSETMTEAQKDMED